MKPNRIRHRTIALILMGLVLFQSCSIYHKAPTTLEKASREKVKTRVSTTNGEVFKYKYISFEDGIFYGITKRSGEFVKTPLSEEETAKVVLKNKSASTWASWGLVGSIVIPLTIVIIIGIDQINTEGYAGW